MQLCLVLSFSVARQSVAIHKMHTSSSSTAHCLRWCLLLLCSIAVGPCCVLTHAASPSPPCSTLITPMLYPHHTNVIPSRNPCYTSMNPIRPMLCPHQPHAVHHQASCSNSIKATLYSHQPHAVTPTTPCCNLSTPCPIPIKPHAIPP